MRNKELYEAMQGGHLYDYISNKGYNHSKDELIDIIKELNFKLYEEHRDDFEQVEKDVCEELRERGMFED